MEHLFFNIYYFILYGVLAIAGFSFATSPSVIKTDKLNNQLIILFSVWFFFLFGSRYFGVGTDTPAYVRAFQSGLLGGDIGFRIFAGITRLLSDNGRFFLYAVSFILILPMCIFFCKVKYESKFLLFFIFTNMFFFRTLGINIIRHGIAISFFLLAILYLGKIKILATSILFLLSFSFHYAMIIPIVLYIVSIKLKTLLIPVLCFFIATVLSLFAFNFPDFLRSIPVLGSWSLLMSRLDSIEHSAQWAYYFRTGFRPDFFIFNLFFAILGLLSYKHAIKYISRYRVYLSAFLFTSAFFFLMFQLPFSDRFGLMSWIFIPFLMLPFIQEPWLFGKYGKIFSLILVIIIHVLLINLES